MRSAGVGAVLALSLWGALEFYASTRSVTADPYRVSDQLERYAPLTKALSAQQTLGYLSDLEYTHVSGQVLFFGAQYALAPRLLLSRPDGPLVLGNFSHTQDYNQAGEKYGLRLQQDFGNGVVLFRKESR